MSTNTKRIIGWETRDVIHASWRPPDVNNITACRPWCATPLPQRRPLDMASALAKIDDTKSELPYPGQYQPSTLRRRPYGPWIVLALLMCTGYMMIHCPNTLSEAQHKVHPINVPERIQRSWAMYSPWRPEGTYPPPPVGCQVTQVRADVFFLCRELICSAVR